MKKRIMALMLFLPIMLMLTIFTVTKTVGIIVEIPASGIHITTQTEDGILSLDMANYANDIYITAEVEPLNAKNKNFSYTIAGVAGEAPADIEIDSLSGLLTLRGTGRAKVSVVSATGGYSDSIIVSSYSTKVLRLLPALENAAGEALELTPIDNGEYDYYANITSGLYSCSVGVNPKNLSSGDILWTSDNSNIFEINPITGKAIAKLSGSVTLTVDSDNSLNENVKRRIRLNVEPQQTLSGLTVNGGENGELLCPLNAEYAEFLLEKTAGGADIILAGEGMGGVQSYTITPLNDSETQFKVRLRLNYGHAAELSINITAGGLSNTIKLVFADYNLGIFTGYHLSSADLIIHKKGSAVIYAAQIEPYDDDVTYEWSSGGELLQLAETAFSGIYRITALAEGLTTLTVTAYNDSVEVAVTVKTVRVVAPVSSIEFLANAATYGIEDILAVGSQRIDNGEYVSDRPELAIKMRTDQGLINYAGKELNFVSSDNSVLSPYVTLTGFKVNAVDEGVVTVTAKWLYADYFKENISASVTLRAVSEGVSVSSYAELVKASEDGKKIVLNSNIMLGRQGATLSELKAMAKQLPTTYDWQFYKNKGQERPSVYYLVEFKNDVYGNGYFINGEYITQASDNTGVPLLFKGPLDFVSVSTAAVKAQDNIVFLVRTDGITLNNVVLKGCNDESLVENNEYNLSKLNYTGTTLEIMANATVKNSRVSNGRTVVRIFGGKTVGSSPIIESVNQINAIDERVTVLLESCILTSAREFIVKIGSNRAVKSKGDSELTFEPSKLTRQNGEPYNPFDTTNADDEYFKEKYLITDVTIRNCVLATSGLFSIGMETHFSGIMLSGYSSANVNNWKDMASTSYACALHLEGNVKLLDWKKLENIDSSTLIETADNAQAFLTLDISAMIDKVYSTHTGYSDILSIVDQKAYVHGGIAMYGGGYNYSYVDTKTFAGEAMEQYRINLSVLSEGREQDINDILYLQGTVLPLAAGYSDFRFYMYNKNSQNDYNLQRQEIESGTAYVIPVAE
ncbi:MAG: hypothetical protein EOM87_01625 [Clostridia bacterium]|nr:hypothetical protein [Clostridia bacterium]